MCGIAGVYIKDPAVIKDHSLFEKFADHLLLGNEGRGKHATGFVAVTFDGQVRMDKADVPASDFIKDREPIPEGVQIFLGHTRYATKGDVKNYLNNHPVLHGSCFTTHNGSIDNDDELFAKYRFPRSAEVDTEILPALVGVTDFDPVRIREAFKDVDGSCAMATIDPVNHPGKVLLLRTNNKSPLYLIDTPKYVIWASTQNNMRDAWGKVLGTPPKFSKFKYIPEWKFMILEGQPEAGTYDLEKKPDPTWQASSHHHGAGSHVQVKDPVTNQWVTKAELDKRTAERAKEAEKKSANDDRVTVFNAEVRDRVAQMRKDGVARAMTWDQKSTGTTGRKWLHCNVCRNMIIESDHTETLGRGSMCVDCADTFNIIYAEKCAAADKKDRSLDADAGLMEVLDKALPNDLKDRLNNWGEDEAQVHTQLMEFLADGTGVSQTVLEFLMFRGNMKDIESDHPELLPLIEKLWEEYDSEYATLWDEVDPVGTDAFGKVVKYKGKAQSPGTSVSGITRHTHPVTCHFSNGNAAKRLNNCLFCRKKAKVRLVMADRAQFDFNYCTNHHQKCSVKGCTGDANHTRKDGMRVCHTHARSTKECYADTILPDMGYSLEAV